MGRGDRAYNGLSGLGLALAGKLPVASLKELLGSVSNGKMHGHDAHATTRSAPVKRTDKTAVLL